MARISARPWRYGGWAKGPIWCCLFSGPPIPRDAAGLATDAVIDPTNFIHFKQHIWWSAAREYFTLLDLKGQTYQTMQGIQRSSVDYYAGLRSLYRQLRNNEIRNGRAGRGPGSAGILSRYLPGFFSALNLPQATANLLEDQDGP